MSWLIVWIFSELTGIFLSESHYLELGCLSDKTAHILSIDINEKITFRRVRHLISLIVLPYTWDDPFPADKMIIQVSL